MNKALMFMAGVMFASGVDRGLEGYPGRSLAFFALCAACYTVSEWPTGKRKPEGGGP